MAELGGSVYQVAAADDGTRFAVMRGGALFRRDGADGWSRLGRSLSDEGSAHELATISAACGPGFQTVVPGIRPAGAALGDQKRVMTPADAVRAGAAYLVIGRPITQAADPAAAAQSLAAEIAAAG